MFDPKKLSEKAFICPDCGSPHFGTVRLDTKEGVHIIICHGNEWTSTPSYGWRGPAKDGFVDLSVAQKQQLDRLQGRDVFFEKLDR